MNTFTSIEVAELIGRDRSTISRWRKELMKRGVCFDKANGEYVYTEETYRLLCDLANVLDEKEVRNLDEAVTMVMYGIDPEVEYFSESIPQDGPTFVNENKLRILEEDFKNWLCDLEEKQQMQLNMIDGLSAQQKIDRAELKDELNEMKYDLNKRDAQILAHIRDTQELNREFKNRKLTWKERLKGKLSF